MRVGFIGAGSVTSTFGRHLIIAGHTLVVSNSRGPETLVDFVADLGPNAIAATNAHLEPPDISLAGVTRSRAALKGRTSSEIVAEMAVGARLVKSISNMPMVWIPDFSPQKPRTVIFTSGDDTEAKQLVIELINSVGFVAVVLGSLATGSAMHEVGAPLSGPELHFVRRLR